MVVQPLGAFRSSTQLKAQASASALARCRHCYGYINYLCQLGDSSFTCSICGRNTDFNSLTLWHNQYCRYPAARQHLPELQQQVYEVLVDPEAHEASAAAAQLPHQQVTLCVCVCWFLCCLCSCICVTRTQSIWWGGNTCFVAQCCHTCCVAVAKGGIHMLRIELSFDCCCSSVLAAAAAARQC